MDFLQPASWQEALAMRAERPDALPIAGGTDVMVELNFDRRRPGALLDLGRVAELREWAPENGLIRLGAGVPYGRIITELGRELLVPVNALGDWARRNTTRVNEARARFDASAAA